MKILIVSATQFEILPLLEELPQRFKQIKSDVFNNEKHEIKILITGVGLTHTSFALGWVLSTYKPDLAINAGLCGAFDKNLKIGEVVNVVAESFGDLGVEERDGRFTDVFELGLINENEKPFVNSRLYNAEISGFDFLPAVRGLTVNKVHGFSVSIDKIIEKYQADIESMEGAAFYFACLQAAIPFMEIRSVSNYVEPRNKENWSIPLAIDNLNVTLLDLLDILTAEPDN